MRQLIKVKELSVSEKDCEFSFARGTGKGGQKRNKTSTAARCKHKESGAVGYSDETRSQCDNKKRAFAKMTKTQEFNEWQIRKIAKIEELCNPEDLKVEIGNF